MRSLLAALALVSSPAVAHSWYEARCCSDQDCRQVDGCTLDDGTQGIVIEGQCAPIDWSKVQPMPSPDGQWHACLGHRLDGRGPQVRCIYGGGAA